MAPEDHYASDVSRDEEEEEETDGPSSAIPNQRRSCAPRGSEDDAKEKPTRWRCFREFNPGAKGQSFSKRLRTYTQKVWKRDPYEWQLKVATAIGLGEDVVVSVGTGHGKSLIFQMLAALKKSGKSGTLLIISPLSCLLRQQAKAFCDAGIPAVALIDGEVGGHLYPVWDQIDKGEFRVVYAGPERIFATQSPFWLRLKGDHKKNKFLSRLVGFVIDECHTIHQWGASGFRLDFRGDRETEKDLP